MLRKLLIILKIRNGNSKLDKYKQTENISSPLFFLLKNFIGITVINFVHNFSHCFSSLFGYNINHTIPSFDAN